MKNALIFIFFLAVQTHAQNVDSLTESLTRSAVNDSLKVVRIYEWITKNVKYESRQEQKRAANDTTLWQEAPIVIQRKKALCIGYAKLFKAMCRYIKVESEIIAGQSKNLHGQLEREEHAWNTVKINGKWWILDATWGAGYYTAAKVYFLIDPSVAIETHYPNDPMWQLLAQPKNFACFLKRTNCPKEETSVFNFRDTIAKWRALDTFHQVKNSAERSLKYHPNCLDALRDLANAYSTEGFHEFQNFANWRSRVISRQNTPETLEEVQKWLDTVDNNLQQARFFYDRIITTFARKGDYTDAHFNRELMQENLLKLENERKFVVSFFKTK
jgi:Transglutaminase-like superfamily